VVPANAAERSPQPVEPAPVVETAPEPESKPASPKPASGKRRPAKPVPKPDPAHRYRRPYEGTDVAEGAMQAYLDWEYGLVEQLRRDATHGFFVI